MIRLYLSFGNGKNHKTKSIVLDNNNKKELSRTDRVARWLSRHSYISMIPFIFYSIYNGYYYLVLSSIIIFAIAFHTYWGSSD